MIIATYNINSVRIRQEALQSVVDKAKPDILCLQETKVDDPLFPSDDLKKLGFEYIYFSGQKSYNGVAILSRVPLSDIKNQPIINEDRRHISARMKNGVEIHNFYVPAGGDTPDPAVNPKFAHKLAFLDEMRACAALRCDSNRMILVGDLNVAPLEHDVWSHKQMLRVVSHTPLECEKLVAVQNAGGWIDAMRMHTPEPAKLYTWWSYRSPDWQTADKGRRLDHIWVAPALADRLTGMRVLKHSRGWLRPSDHVPVTATLDL